MKNKKLTMGVVILAIVLILGVAYAAISNITLNITGSASASATQSNFNAIGFCKSAADNTIVTSTTPVTGTAKHAGGDTIDGASCTASITSATEASISVSGLNTKDDVAEVTLYVANNNTDLYANVVPTITNNDDTSSFTITTTPAEATSTKIAPGGTIQAYKVTVRLNRTIAQDVSAKTFTITLTASASES